MFLEEVEEGWTEQRSLWDQWSSVSREAMMLKKAIQTRLLATFFRTVGVSIIGLGYLFNLVL